MKLRSLLFLFCIVLFLASCGDKKEAPERIDPGFTNHISGFTAGVVSNQARIRIRLTEPVSSAVVGEEVDESLFDFSPNIDGKTIWIDNKVIEFQPNERLPSGTIYDVEFELGKLKDVPSKLETFEFRFQTITQGIFVVFESMKAYDDNHLEWQQLSGSIQTNDYADLDALQKTLEASQNGKELTLSWEFDASGLSHHFEVDSVSRGEKEGKVILFWSGEEIDAETEGEEVIVIPALGDFKVMSVTVEQLPKQTITVNFSDPINHSQNLNGLIFSDGGEKFRLRKEGNTVYLYPSNDLFGTRKLTVSKSIKNTSDYPLSEEFSKSIVFNNTKPEIAFVGSGNILPSMDGFKLPIKAVNLSGVNVRVIKVFEDKVLQFFQVNDQNGESEMKRVGRLIAKESISFLSDKKINFATWNTFNLDLTDMVKVEPGAIYRITLSFDQSQSLYPCDSSEEVSSNYNITDKELAWYDTPLNYYYDYYPDYEYDPDYNYKDQDNPCKASFYSRRKHSVTRNILASNIGIIAKSGNETEFKVAITDLKTTKPISGAEVELFNFQGQKTTSVSTDGEGFASIDLKGSPFLLVASHNNQKGYLRVDDGSALSLSMFDVGGERNTKGVKGFIYGERGVWRPGDSLFLSFILEDKNQSLPEDHPVIFELYTPGNQLFQRMVKTKGLNGFYDLRTATSSSSPTGNWQAKVKVGNSIFRKRLKIEAVKPNRLKIKIEFDEEILSRGNTNGTLSAKWLHGADADDLRATMEMNLSSGNTSFKGHPDYHFDDPSKSFSTDEEMVFDGNLSSIGETSVSPDILVAEGAPGMLNASFKTRVFEKGGDFSVDRFRVKYSPYDSYVGVKIPKGKGWNDALYSNEPNLLPIVTLDEKGNPVDRKNLKIEIFDIYWRWWWERGDGDDLARYVSNKSRYLIKSETISTKGGKALYQMEFNENHWGRKMIRITDPVTGHSTGATFYLTYKGWWNSNSGNNPGGAEMLSFATDKKKYQVGEQVKLELPDLKEGRVLVSIETGSKIISTFWKEASEISDGITFETTDEMAPNVYAHLTLIQAHASTANDLPIRMYGVQNIEVEAASTHLNPVLEMPDELAPEQKVKLNVSEKDGKAMTYTVAVVDEGLLDLTRFQTPDPWPNFYKREALGIKTWDLYQYVMGAFSGEISGLLAFGGDGNLKGKDGTKANRFKPVVTFLGPFELEEGDNNDHEFTMPNYVGSVRTMVIAGNQGAYGSTDKATPVKKALMVLATLPRVVSPSEKLKLPVTVFAMDEKISNVKVTVEANEFFSLPEKQKTINFSKVGDQVLFFDIIVKEKIGVGKVKVTVEGKGEKATHEIEIGIRLPNPEIDKTLSDVVENGQTWSSDYQPIGIEGTNKGAIEVSIIPPLNLERRLDYLIRYPHGCIEQTTSSVFPQLFLTDLVKLSADRTKEIQSNISNGLKRIRTFQLNNGGFSYWPGGYEASTWGTNYAGHFVVEAKNKGYAIPTGMFDDWVKFQTKAANAWASVKNSYNSRGYRYGRELEQAYRLYALALAGKSAMGAMNRLREQATLSQSAKWRLAAAYVLSNKMDVAK
ncbi:MAG: hypothetical protein JKY48_12605, partial [Flavobacteriales bacterium]|nr:hypothetical protein [Flavobacteriales bacterium]